MTFETCPYCGNPAAKVTGAELYSHWPELAKKLFWACMPCKAWVGCHPGGDLPLGRLANAELRRAKMDAHAAFDPFWKTGILTRSEAYKWLSKELGIDREQCHIGWFDVEMCRKVVVLCTRKQMEAVCQNTSA